MVDKRRRSKAEILELRRWLVEIVGEHRPLTIRHLFYLAVAKRLIEKVETEYKNVIIRLTGEMREDWLQAQAGWEGLYQVGKRLMGDDANYVDSEVMSEWLSHCIIPFGSTHIVDAGRWIRKPRTHESIEDALRNTAEFYRRDLWGTCRCRSMFFARKTPSPTSYIGKPRSMTCRWR